MRTTTHLSELNGARLSGVHRLAEQCGALSRPKTETNLDAETAAAVSAHAFLQVSGGGDGI
jgi:hypothetical protein